jgi:PAS domain S-box-containing protein
MPREDSLNLQGELDAMTRLHDVVARVLACSDLATALDEILVATMEIAGAEMGSVRLLNARGDALEIVAQRGFGQDFLDRFRDVRLDDDSGFTLAMREGVRIVVEDVRTDPLFDAQRATVAAAGFLAVQSTPLLSRTGDLLGVLSTHHARPRRPSESELRMLDLCARQAADVIERTRREEALRESEERYRAVVDQSPDAILVVAGGRCVYVNSAGARLLGATDAAALIGHAPFEFVEPEYHDAVREGMRVVLEGTGHAPPLEYCWRRLDGSAVEVEVSSGRIVWHGAAAVLVTARDVSERRRAEAQLRRSHETFFNLIQSSPFGIYIVDAGFRLRQVSAGAQKVFQHVRPLIGRDFADVLRAIWQEPFAGEAIARFRHTLATGEPYVAVDTTEKRADIAEVEAYDWRIERITLPDGQFGVVCHFYDLSQIRRAEAEVRRRVDEAEEGRRILQAIMEYVPEGITVAEGPDVTIRMVSRHGLELAGLPADRPLNEPAAAHPDTWGIYHTDGATLSRPEELPLTRAVRYGEVVINEEWQLRRSDGSIATILCNAGPIRDSDGTIVGGIIAFRDIADLKRAEQMLRDDDRRKDEFLATLGHELRNPLAAIRMALQIVRGAKGDPARFEKMVAIIDRQSLQLVRLIDDLLDVSRIRRDKIALRLRRVELGPIVVQALESIQPFYDSQHVDLSAAVPPQPIMVKADEARLGQVISNVLHNACKYTPEGGRVRVVVEPDGPHAVIRVRDTGEGIAPEHLPVLFEMFSQINPRRDARKGGLGIGLALCRRLVDMHGGIIEARSEGPGRGSEFIVRLPVAVAEVEQPEPAARPEGVAGSSARAPAAPRLRILAVEDNPDALHVLAAHLRLNGHEVVEAEDGEHAVDAAEAHRPQVVILDISLPGMDGYEVARRIRARPWSGDVKFIAMTGRGQDEDKRRAAEAGFDAHLTKPADLDEIERVLLEAARQT